MRVKQRFVRRLGGVLMAVALLATMMPFVGAQRVVAAAGDLFFSEIIEGSSNNKALEIYNCGGSPLDLDTFLLCQTNRGTNNAQGNTQSLNIMGTLASGAVRTYCNSQEALMPATACDERIGTIVGFNGNDSVYIVKDDNNNNTCDATDTVIDAFGHINGPTTGAVWAEQTFSRCDFTPYDGSGTSFDPLMPRLYTALPQNTNAGFGVAPSEGCP